MGCVDATVSAARRRTLALDTHAEATGGRIVRPTSGAATGDRRRTTVAAGDAEETGSDANRESSATRSVAATDAASRDSTGPERDDQSASATTSGTTGSDEVSTEGIPVVARGGGSARTDDEVGVPCPRSGVAACRGNADRDANREIAAVSSAASDTALGTSLTGRDVTAAGLVSVLNPRRMRRESARPVV